MKKWGKFCEKYEKPCDIFLLLFWSFELVNTIKNCLNNTFNPIIYIGSVCICFLLQIGLVIEDYKK